jgi:hypothetical protein
LTVQRSVAADFFLLLVGMTCIANPAVAQTGTPPGVKHRLEVSMSVDREAPALKENRDRPRADVKLRVRISDHAIDSDYFGMVTFDFASADPANDIRVKTIWEDPGCHIDRGLPKISIVDIQGSLAGADKKFVVAAVPRHVGKHIPDDEIIARPVPQSSQRPRKPDEQQGISLRARTQRSGIQASLDLIATRCAL